MMRLHLAPGGSSFSCHVALEESGLPFEIAMVKYEEHSSWATVEKLNPQGAIPVLELDGQKVLTQSLAIMLYVAEKAPQAALLPPVASFERAQALQWLAWSATDLGKAISPLFYDSTPAEVREKASNEVKALLTLVDSHLGGRQYVAGDSFTLADAHLFAVYGWVKWVELPTDSYQNLNAYCARLFERPAFQRVMKREGLI